MNFKINRNIRVFVSSTFKDMLEERNILMTHTWPELRRFCRERQVEIVEVDLRWGISEEQSSRKETLKLCLDEIRACRPYFIGLLGERYGWIPGNESFTEDLLEEEPWLKDTQNKSVTELEILHGVLNNPDMAGRSFFYFRDPRYVETVPEEKRTDLLSEGAASSEKQTTLKEVIRDTCTRKKIPLVENYPDPRTLAQMVLDHLREAIDKQFPKESIPDPLTWEARDHDAYAETRRRTYIGRQDYFDALDRHCMGDGKPLLLVGDSGSGKSALIANWVEHWGEGHPGDFIFQHYIGGTTDSAVHWKVMRRLVSEIKRWTGDDEEIPRTNDELFRDFAVWLVKGRIKAERDGVRFIVLFDALNQLEDRDHAHTLGWLPEEPFTTSNLRLIVSTLPGPTLEALERRSLPTLRIEALTTDECGRMIGDYLRRFGKSLEKSRVERISNTKAATNPLYLKILLDELRVTGTRSKLDERLDGYLSAGDIPSLLKSVLERYQRDYEHDRKGLVGEALGLIWSARRGLTEAELLQLLRPDDLPQLPVAIWSPLRAVLEESLVDRGGILNFAHDFLRSAVENSFVNIEKGKHNFRTRLVDYFEGLAPTARTCDEIPWLLKRVKLVGRLRKYLLNIDCFLEIRERDEEELRSYWIDLGEERSMGQFYLNSFNIWKRANTNEKNGNCSNDLGLFLFNSALHYEAESLLRLSLQIYEESLGKNHQYVASILNNLALVLCATNRMGEAESLIKRAIETIEFNLGTDRIELAMPLNNLAMLLKDSDRLNEAEPIMTRALKIVEDSFDKYHPKVAVYFNSLAELLVLSGRLNEAEVLIRRALRIYEDKVGKNHPNVAIYLNNLAVLFLMTKRLNEAEPLCLRALKIDEDSYGENHPNVSRDLDNLAKLYLATDRINEAEILMRRALKIVEESLGKGNSKVATRLSNLAQVLKYTNRLNEVEPLLRRALEIDEDNFGKDHSIVVNSLNRLALFLYETNRINEAEPLSRRVVEILVNSSRTTEHLHPHLELAIDNYAGLLDAIGWSDEQIITQLRKIAPEHFN
jgi:nephrocystin-3